MGSLKIIVRGLASYLMVVAILGTIVQIQKVVTSVSMVSFISDSCSGRNCSDKSQINNSVYPQAATSHSYWNGFPSFVQSLYFFSFPVISPILSDKGNEGASTINSKVSCRNLDGLSASSYFATLLPSFFLVKGSFKINYSNCKFWYYTQVASLLLGCFKIVLVTLLGLWNAATNVTLIAVLLGLSQLWVVQSFMEKLERQEKNDKQSRFASQLMNLNALEAIKVYKKPKFNKTHVPL